MSRLPRALAAVGGTAGRSDKAPPELFEARMAIPEEHVLHIRSPNVVVTAHDLEVASGALETWHEAVAYDACVRPSRQHLSKQVV